MQDNQAPWQQQRGQQYDPSTPQPSWPPQQQYQGGQPDQVQQYQQPSQQPSSSYGQVQPLTQDRQGYQPAPSGRQVQRHGRGKRYALRGAESFWDVLACMAIGSGYFAKLPAKKAASEILSELQLDGGGPSHAYGLGGAEGFWYVMECLAFGGGYFAKIYAKKGLWELITMLQDAPGQNTEAIFRALRGAPAPAAY
jgi:hypothetical protein